MKRKNLPLIMMLVAGAFTSIITFILKFSIVNKLTSLLIVLLIFYILGNVLKYALDTFDKQNEKADLDEGEVVEKENKDMTEEKPETKKADEPPRA